MRQPADINDGAPVITPRDDKMAGSGQEPTSMVAIDSPGDVVFGESSSDAHPARAKLRKSPLEHYLRQALRSEA